MSFSIVESSVILFLILFQSIFGVGLLIFGTPTFLFFNYSFVETLSILIPISCCISAIQITQNNVDINNFNKIFLKYSLVGVIVFLPISIYFVNLTYLKTIIAFVMIFTAVISLKNLNLTNFRESFLKNSKLFLFLIGCIHGVSNLGGGFISIYSSILYFNEKIKTRKAIAVSYLCFGLIQILILLFTSNFFFEIKVLIFMLVTPIIYYFSTYLFSKINFIVYIKILYLLVLFYGILILILK